MSSCGNPNVDGDALMPRRFKSDGKTKICVKCKETKGNVVIRYAIYCKSCFFSIVQTRFKKSLEPFINPETDGPRRKTLKAAGSLVLGLSGGTCSTTMLDLVAKTYFKPRPVGEEDLKGGKSHPRNSKSQVWKCKPAVCYVEVCGALPTDKDRTDEVRAAVDKYPDTFDFIPLRLEDAFDPTWWITVGGKVPMNFLGTDMADEDLPLSNTPPSTKDPLASLKYYLSAMPTHTAFYNTIQTLTRLLLLHTAASRNASHLLLGTSLTSLSVNLISGIAQGSGFTIVEETQEEWVPQAQHGLSIRVIRPLRDIGMKDCAIWNWWCGLSPVSRLIYNPPDTRSSIERLTRDFIFGLEAEYPATVSTIARTCAKLTTKEASGTTCLLCERPTQPGIQAWKSNISIRSYSDTPSNVPENRPSHLSEDISNSTVHGNSVSSLTSFLCYSCHTTLTSRNNRGTGTPLSDDNSPPSNTLLPVWVGSTLPSITGSETDDKKSNDDSVPTSSSRKDLHSLIEDFLVLDA